VLKTRSSSLTQESLIGVPDDYSDRKPNALRQTRVALMGY